MGKFTESRREVLVRALDQIGFGALISHEDGEFYATNLPLQIVKGAGEQFVLRCHLAASNPHLSALREGSSVLVVCQGPNVYVSPSWYETKRKTGAVVPTWDYIAVQVRGSVTLQSKEQLLEHVSALTDRFESNADAPWAVDDAPREYIEAQLSGIVGVEIRPTRVDGTWKISQNRSVADREGVIAGLRRRGEPDDEALATLVEETLAEPERD